LRQILIRQRGLNRSSPSRRCSDQPARR
jgi:hypothetical protein